MKIKDDSKKKDKQIISELLGSKALISKRIFQRKILVPAILFCGLVFLFVLALGFLTLNYKKSVISDSTSHLKEVNNQISLYVSEKINDFTRLNNDLKDDLGEIEFINETDLKDYLDTKQETWNNTCLMIANADGENVYSGTIDIDNIKNEQISLYCDIVTKEEKYFTTNSGLAIYIIPINLNIDIYGKKSCALISALDLTALMNRMNFSPFESETCFYLADSEGFIVSRLISKNTENANNVSDLIENKTTKITSNDTLDEIINCEKQKFFIIKQDGYNEYGVINKIKILGETWSLVYLVPSNVVNKSTNLFSTYITVLGLFGQILLVVMSIVILIIVYFFQKRNYDSILDVREKLFDLLVKETNNAFCLVKVGLENPIYQTSNLNSIITNDDFKFSLFKIENKFYLECGLEQSENFSEFKESLEGWNGNDNYISPYIVINQNDGIKYISIKLYKIKDIEDEYICIIADATLEKDRQKIIEEALRAAQSANIAKTEFLSSMSHDIRTPMNAILNMTSMAINDVKSIDKTNATNINNKLNVVLNSSKHLLNIINDVLEMSRIESGKIFYNHQGFNIKNSFDNTLNIVRPLCNQKNQKLNTKFLNIKDKFVIGDQTKFEQSIVNLLNNANKYTPFGGVIDFVVEEIPTIKKGYCSFIIKIKDNGIGISEDNLTNIFEPFGRAMDKQVQNIEGTGLGLAIIKTYLQGMNGNISVISEVGVGSIFTIDILFEIDNQVASQNIVEEDEEIKNYQLPKLNVLIVEDNEVNALITKIFVEEFGLDADIAFNGSEGIESFKANNYDLILMDIKMPVMNGYEATIRIRELEINNSKTIPIIALTANVFSEDIEKAKKVGMNGHICKPINKMELKKEIIKVIKNN